MTAFYMFKIDLFLSANCFQRNRIEAHLKKGQICQVFCVFTFLDVLFKNEI